IPHCERLETLPAIRYSLCPRSRDPRPSVFSAFADLSILELLLIAGMGVLTSLIGGVAGYGTGALMPLVLVPIVGAEPVVPIIAISALFTNSSRSAVFWNVIDWRRAAIIIACALPTTMLGAWG